uniref:Protein kinase domain-containing protein n=1 Tax=Polytomella parva TaxID=51329 RepID=A0A7S0VEK4_9CHLO|mmetsp:Transcript_34229/g.61746  ORF Transcript_34229/g.61746 Transcript_34229/m.61746 type:complete len:541 (+) Transcript_34229:156-1778(+)|eukprot:CAMPEP_0175051396 /NCGR_PEP_ID=MMETSP0052_2-20121109/7772_1 /TAXON_ID=51329 ORGANISM="Polytomella parva, Strain SAG 63-3" /NCGR_SAMPLE_ID=MMETSP0052_2 /ASSEMBLY_ACC=CAM_ASM_000194 /LENGTH=540 /DNA_ID=CAMNT_0016315667 /DNA_START=92 /DNA_END=1714 /DNA_ORIENTATION=+
MATKQATGPDQDSLHGENAARRQAITELLFFASVGDLYRCRKIIQAWCLNIKDPGCCDYDRRTPLHLSAAEGAFSVVTWLLDHGHEINCVDRFKRTPLEDAVRGDHGEIVSMLIQRGGKVVDKTGQLVDLADSPLAGNVRIFNDYDPEWEIDPASIQMLDKIGEGEFGVVYKGNWNGTIVAVKVLKEAGSVALGDFRTELNVLQKVHHPHTVQFLGAVTNQKPFMIVTEYMVGGSLYDLFKTGKVPILWRSIQIALDMARGLAYLHSRSPQAVIHRDLKPANLMFGGPKVYNSYHRQQCWDETGVLKIADFGLSKSLKLAKPRRGGSTFNSSIGNRSMEGLTPDSSVQKNGDSSIISGISGGSQAFTPSYKLTGETGSYRFMAPEVFRHELYNNKVDVYSFAMICFQLFDGMPPYWNMDPVEAARNASLRDMRPTWGSSPTHSQPVPENIKSLVEICWAADHNVRPEFMDVVDLLNGISNEMQPPPMMPLALPAVNTNGGGNGGSAATAASAGNGNSAAVATGKSAKVDKDESGGCCTVM